jgi:hypothetical protein
MNSSINGTNLTIEIHRIFNLALCDTKSIEAMGLKLFEEGGELAEAINHKIGNLPHKTMKEPLVGEVADVINCALSIYVKAYPGFTTEQLYVMLCAQLHLKSNKWASIIGVNETI